MYDFIKVGALLLISLSLNAEKISFSEQIRPLLNRNCTGCHGGVKQAGGFSLLYKESAFGKSHHGIGIVPGKPEESMLYKLITSPPEVFDKHKNKTRRLEHMPMEKEPLSAAEIALIKKWIEEGAEWEEHWAYNNAKKQTLPKVDSDWPKNRIDHFTLAKMQSLKLSPSKEADKEILLRRLYLDITGLPPSYEEIQNFKNDTSPKAYENLVDKLLASPAYGEKLSGMWMDLARYSDTQGYEKDSPRTIYRFRDEVIKAFNNDTPYDQFVIEQMAGDLLPNPTEHQKILTAFHRNTMTNTEGGTNDEEFRVAAVLDRVNTTWEAFLGTSYGCVQCHTHPYDPFTHAEYYKFMAYFNNTADSDKGNEAPTITTPDIYQQKQLDEWNKSLAELKLSLKSETNTVLKEFDSRYTTLIKDMKAPETLPLKATDLNSDSDYKLMQNEDMSFSSAGNKAKSVFTISGTVETDKLNLLQIDAIKIKNSYGHSGNFVLSSVSMKVKKKAAKSEKKADFKSAVATFEQKGFPAKDSLDKNKDKGWAVAGAQNDIETAWFSTKEDIKLEKGDIIEVTLAFESKHAKHVMSNFNIKLGYGKVNSESFALISYKDKNVKSLSKGDREFIVNHFLRTGPASKAYKQKEDLEKKIKGQKVASTPIMQELPADKKRKTHVFIRGNWEDLDEQVSEGTPEVMNKFDPKWPKNRLGMAYWMTSKENPLFARVAVNRFWEQIFGMGIVETLEDFGSQGIKPTHPKLLDDLAYRFANEHKWSMKSLIKEILMSATYRQSSDVDEKLIEADPFNHFLARGPRFRLSAEQVRDQALKVSGLISEKMYGPSVMPFQPEGVWMTVYNGGKWTTSKNGDQYRRGLYTYWKRTSPYPSMEAFDAPSREVCKVRRIRTNTPLQALVTLNDPVYMECAKEFGKVIKAQSGDIDAKLAYAFERALSRKAKTAEITALKKLFTEIQRDYKKPEEDAWTLVANVIMNLDEFLVKR